MPDPRFNGVVLPSANFPKVLALPPKAGIFYLCRGCCVASHAATPTEYFFPDEAEITETLALIGYPAGQQMLGLGQQHPGQNDRAAHYLHRRQILA